MKLLISPAALLIMLGLVVAGCSTQDMGLAPADTKDTQMAVDGGSGSGRFTFEAKYTYFKSYPGGQAIYLLRIVPRPDFVGDVAVSVSSGHLVWTELTDTILNRESPMAELVVSPSSELPFDSIYYITVTASSQSQQQSVVLELHLVDWGVNSVSLAIEARQQFIPWLEAEYPELGSFDCEPWKVYCHYPQILIHEHYTHLSDKWELRVSRHVTWTPEDYYTTLWLRPRGQWDPILTAERVWDDAAQDYVICETPLMTWLYCYDY